MKILTGKDIHREEWSRLVKTSATGTWFQTPEAYDFFAAQPELFEVFAVGVAKSESRVKSKESRELRGVCVGYVTKEKGIIRQFFTRRAIIIGGPALADDATSKEVELLMEGVKELTSERMNGAPIYIETRNFNDYSKWKNAFEYCVDHPRRKPLLPYGRKDAPGFAYQPHLNFHVDCTDQEAMAARLSENRKRQIKKGERIEEAEATEQDVREWYGILQKLYQTKVKTPLFPLSFFLEFYRQKLGKFLLVRHEGHVIGGVMCAILEGRCVYEWFECGENSIYKEQYPSVMATWAGMMWAHEQGCPRYDMMGAGEPGVPYGVRDFKSEFGGETVEHGRFLYIAKPLLYRIGVWGVRQLKRK